jgi:hypothetical protein
MPSAPIRIARATASFHRATERHTALELQRDVLRDELRVDVGTADLVDVDEAITRR